MFNCPHYGKGILERNVAWMKILALKREVFLQNKNPYELGLKFYIDAETEEKLSHFTCWEMGPDLVQKIMAEGVRGFFTKMSGLPVVWDAPKLELK